MRRFFIALATGFGIAYGAVRTAQSAKELRQPAALARKDAAAYGRARRGFMLMGILRSTAVLAAFAYGAADGVWCGESLSNRRGFVPCLSRAPA